MRVLVLHSAVSADAPPDDLDTLATARALGETLQAMGHSASLAPFGAAPDQLRRALDETGAEIVFNLVESVMGQDGLAAIAPALLEDLGIAYTGSAAASIALAGDKPLAKRVMRAAGFPTPDWSEPVHWNGISEARRYIVKSATEDASLGLDDGAVLSGRSAIMARARACRTRFGGRWFAEAYIEGAEYNVALIAGDGALRALPIPEMRFEEWPAHKPRIVGYDAKWMPDSEESNKTVRVFGLEQRSPALAERLATMAREAGRLFDLRGYARVDFRVDEEGNPFILEINPNPSIDPEAGFAAAALQGGLSYRQLVAGILDAAVRT